jgi:hypothetical protein
MTTTGAPLALMLDSNIADMLVADPALSARVQSLADRSVIRLVKTFMQNEEHTATPDPEHRRALVGAFAKVEQVDPGVFVLDTPNLDHARFAGPDGEALYEAVHHENPRHLPDGIIAATALAECDVLVTKDGRMTTKARAAGLTVWTPQDFIAFVERETGS